MARRVITEQDILGAHRRREKTIELDSSVVVTAAARDRAKSLGIAFVNRNPTSPPVSHSAKSGGGEAPKKGMESGTIVVGSDHGGYQLKELLKKFLIDLGYRVTDVGTDSEEPCDYPDFAFAVATLVSKGEAWRGIVIDGAGIGSAIVANKVPDVRAACCHNEFVARNSREHNDVNVLTLGSRVLGTELAKEVVKAWLETWFGGGRHARRLEKIQDVERRFRQRG